MTTRTYAVLYSTLTHDTHMRARFLCPPKVRELRHDMLAHVDVCAALTKAHIETVEARGLKLSATCGHVLVARITRDQCERTCTHITRQ